MRYGGYLIVLGVLYWLPFFFSGLKLTRLPRTEAEVSGRVYPCLSDKPGAELISSTRTSKLYPFPTATILMAHGLVAIMIYRTSRCVMP